MGCSMTYYVHYFLGRDKNVNKGGKQNARQSVGQRQSDKHEATDEPGMNIMWYTDGKQNCKKMLGYICSVLPKGVRDQNNVF